LICDDEGAIRDILVRLVRREGYDTLEAADGITALAVIRQGSPDVLFLDIRMPGLDGVEVVRRARQLTPDLPIVMITTAMAAEAIAALQCGATGYLLKPFRHEDVIGSLQQAMSLRQPHPTSAG